ncbi:MAG TPA: glycosyltransferase family 39 protein [Candidatus Methylomirabilis sp.]|nr:glycosyltransferase family 39 protein [Candidatus Methylomirabilis sp.]
MEGEGSASVERSVGRDKRWLCLLILCVSPFFIHLGANALWDESEPWSAEPPREMVESGNYLVPTYSDVPRFRKPPLTYWIIAPFYLLFGVNEFAARLPGAIAASLTVALTYLIGRNLANPQVALMAALILATTPRFFLFARVYHMDTFLTLFVTAAIYFFLRARVTAKVWNSLLAYGMTAMAVLTKGIVGALIPLAAMTPWGIRNRDLRRSLLSPFGLGLLVLLALPWYILMYTKFGEEFLRVHFFLEHYQRAVSSRLGAKPITFLLKELLIGLLPWSAFMLPATVFVLGRIREPLKTVSERPLALLPVWWFGFVLAFFSLSSGKRELYLMPLYPAMALTLGEYFAEAPFMKRGAYRLVHQGLCLLLVCLVFGLGLVAWQILQPLEGSSGKAALAVGLCALLAGALAWPLWTNRLDLTGPTLAGIVATLAWLVVLALPLVEQYRDVKPLALEVSRQAGPSDLVGTYGMQKASFQFYVGRRPFYACSEQEIQKILHGRRRVFLLAPADAFESLRMQSDIPLEILARGRILSIVAKRWPRQGFTEVILAVSKPLDSGEWQADPSRPYPSCAEVAEEHP